MQKSLDRAIRLSLKQKGGYELGNRSYENYMDNESWNSFLAEMKLQYKEAYCAYRNGGGSELKEKRYPPKMASFGSSSRFVYLLARDIKGFKFEHKFNTSFGGSSNLDGYLEDSYISICTEAKCREPYGGSHQGEKRSAVYKALLAYISENNEQISFQTKSCGTNKISIISKCNNSIIQHFDVIQLICHFCGIANQLLKGEINPNIRFVYLIYNPQNLDESLFVRGKKKKILKRYADTIMEMQSVDMKKLFATIISFFSGLHSFKYSFEFISADQDSFNNAVSSLVLDIDMRQIEKRINIITTVEPIKIKTSMKKSNFQSETKNESLVQLLIDEKVLYLQHGGLAHYLDLEPTMDDGHRGRFTFSNIEFFDSFIRFATKLSWINRNEAMTQGEKSVCKQVVNKYSAKSISEKDLNTLYSMYAYTRLVGAMLDIAQSSEIFEVHFELEDLEMRGSEYERNLRRILSILGDTSNDGCYTLNEFTIRF